MTLYGHNKNPESVRDNDTFRYAMFLKIRDNKKIFKNKKK